MTEDPCPLRVGQLIRFTDPSNCNTIYEVSRISLHRKAQQYNSYRSSTMWSITLKIVFGLFKQDYKRTKNTKVNGGKLGSHIVVVTVADMLKARDDLDTFIKERM